MYVIVVYDFEAERTRIPRKLLRQHLQHVQNSVFEGEISEGQVEEIKQELTQQAKTGESVIIYELWSDTYVDRTTIGDDPMDDTQFI